MVVPSRPRRNAAPDFPTERCERNCANRVYSIIIARTPWRFWYTSTGPAYAIDGRDPTGGIVPCSVELCEAVVAVNDVKRPSQFGQERDCWSPFRSERQARPRKAGSCL